VGPAQPMDHVSEADRDQIMRSVRATVIRLHRRLGGAGGDEANAIAAAGLEGIARANSAGELK
jgi:1-acyl-sn-glycerol-3-phosphate acyltransferase